MSERDFEETGRPRLDEGDVVGLARARFRFVQDGTEREQDVVDHPGGVGIVAIEDGHVLLVRQPRPAVGEPDLLELPAGRVEPGEDPLETAKRELAEEAGRRAGRWTRLTGSTRRSPPTATRRRWWGC